jgi:hypothetical protein
MRIRRRCTIESSPSLPRLWRRYVEGEAGGFQAKAVPSLSRQSAGQGFTCLRSDVLRHPVVGVGIGIRNGDDAADADYQSKASSQPN